MEVDIFRWILLIGKFCVRKEYHVLSFPHVHHNKWRIMFSNDFAPLLGKSLFFVFYICMYANTNVNEEQFPTIQL